MKTKFLLVIFAFGYALNATGQNTLELTFSAIENTDFVQLDSIKIINQTQGGDTVLYYPDTVLVLDYLLSIPAFGLEDQGFSLSQNYPNPVTNQTRISLYIPEKGLLNITATGISGNSIIQDEIVLDKGHHSFRLKPGNENIIFFTASWQGQSRSIKIINQSEDGNTSSLAYRGSKPGTPDLKASKNTQEFMFSLGDELLYIGYANSFQSGILDAPEYSQNYIFQFATNIPCPGTPTVEYEGQVYNTIQIFSQCWLQENLNVGTRINGENSTSNNGIIEKYCYYNSEDSCSKYGGLYRWPEMMQYNSIQGSQGICPSGWHIPTDEEWKILEGSVDSHYGIEDEYWNAFQMRGTDVGTKLKSEAGWSNGGNGNNTYEFTALAGGLRGPDGLFYVVGTKGLWWTSTILDSDIIYRELMESQPGIYRLPTTLQLGMSVRCLKD